MTLSHIGIVNCGSADHSASWKIMSSMEVGISRLLRSDSCKGCLGYEGAMLAQYGGGGRSSCTKIINLVGLS